MITGKHIAETAVTSGLLGTPYKQMDCQAFVEKVLEIAGLKIINYRGSNHMWRDLVYDRRSVRGNKVPAGTLVFIVRADGGEKKRGYNDDMQNATHVGIALGDERVMESTTGGVQFGNLSRFTNYAFIKDVDYGEEKGNEGKRSTLDTLLTLVSVLRDNLDSLEVAIRDLHGGT